MQYASATNNNFMARTYVVLMQPRSLFLSFLSLLILTLGLSRRPKENQSIECRSFQISTKSSVLGDRYIDATLPPVSRPVSIHMPPITASSQIARVACVPSTLNGSTASAYPNVRSDVSMIISSSTRYVRTKTKPSELATHLNRGLYSNNS